MVTIQSNDGVCQVSHPGTRWLSSGVDGGFHEVPAAYNVTVPEAWQRVNLDEYATERRQAAGFEESGVTLFTGVNQRHAQIARAGPVTVVVTAGLSNPATLPMEPDEQTETDERTVPNTAGTVNVLCYAETPLTDGARTTLLAAIVEAKTATLLETAGITGTTTDAVVVGAPHCGDTQRFAGSATELGGAARAAVRDGIRASLDSRYEKSASEIVETSPYGVRTIHRATVQSVQERSGTSGSIE